MSVIDVHTHMFTAKWLELLKKEGGIYNIKTRPDGQQEIFRGDTPVVHSPDGAISTTNCASSTWMRRASTFRSSRSPVPTFIGAAKTSACRAARESNDTWREAQSKYPDRIRWFTSLPWEYPQRADRRAGAHAAPRARWA